LGRQLSKDVPLQVLSVLLAVVLWMQASAVQNPVDRFDFSGVPVVIEDVPEGLVVTAPPQPHRTDVTLKCRRRVADRLDPSSLVAKVSLLGGVAGTADFAVRVDAPEGVEVVSVSPGSVSVTLETVSTAEAPVQPKLVGTVPSGYVAGAPSAAPGVVTVRGPASAVWRVATVVAKIDVSQATSDISTRAVLEARDSQGTIVAGVTFVPADVVVSAAVTALPAPVSVDVDPILTGSPASGYAVLGITCEPARVQARPGIGGTIDFDRLPTEPVNIAGSTSDVEATVKVVVPDGVAEVVPAEVMVTVEIGWAVSFEGLTVAVREVPSGLVASVSPPEVGVLIRGPRSLLDRLTADDVDVWVDASGRSAGQWTVVVNVTLPDWAQDLDVVGVNPDEVSLTLGR